MVKKSAAIVFMLTAVLFPAASESKLTMDIKINNIFLKTRNITTREPYWGWMTAGSAGFSFKSTGNSNVKADTAFSFGFPEIPLTGSVSQPAISLDRAYIKARFPEFRITAGKTRLSWGDGFVFNSADVIFGSTDSGVDLTASEVRSDTRWLTAVNVPLGRFSFVEAAAVTPQPATPTGDDFTGFTVGKISDFSAGARFYTRIEAVKVEGGYYYDNSGPQPLHKPFLSFQGNLFADWYAAASAALGSGSDIQAEIEESLNMSFGLFHIISLGRISSLTLRLEGLYRPFSTWREAEPAEAPGKVIYPLMLYPEISYAPVDAVSISVRSIFSPVDLSALITAGAAWNVFQGFNLNAHAVINAGDGSDIFAWNRHPELWNTATDMVDRGALIITAEYIY